MVISKKYNRININIGSNLTIIVLAKSNNNNNNPNHDTSNIKNKIRVINSINYSHSARSFKLLHHE